MLCRIADSAITRDLGRFEFVWERVFHHSFGEWRLYSHEKFANNSHLVFLFLFHGIHLPFQFRQGLIHFAWLSGCELSIPLYAAIVAIVAISSAAMAFFFMIPYIGRLVLTFLLLQMQWFWPPLAEFFILLYQLCHLGFQGGNTLPFPSDLGSGRWLCLIIKLDADLGSYVHHDFGYLYSQE
jgi:hypothetical protein